MDESIVRHLDQVTDSPAEVLRRAKALIADPDKWCCEDAKIGERRCVIQAICEVDERNGYNGPAAGFLDIASNQLFGEPTSIANYRGHAAAIQMFDRAIALAERG